MTVEATTFDKGETLLEFDAFWLTVSGSAINEILKEVNRQDISSFIIAIGFLLFRNMEKGKAVKKRICYTIEINCYTILIAFRTIGCYNIVEVIDNEKNSMCIYSTVYNNYSCICSTIQNGISELFKPQHSGIV